MLADCFTKCVPNIFFASCTSFGLIINLVLINNQLTFIHPAPTNSNSIGLHNEIEHAIMHFCRAALARDNLSILDRESVRVLNDQLVFGHDLASK